MWFIETLWSLSGPPANSKKFTTTYELFNTNLLTKKINFSSGFTTSHPLLNIVPLLYQSRLSWLAVTRIFSLSRYLSPFSPKISSDIQISRPINSWKKHLHFSIQQYPSISGKSNPYPGFPVPQWKGRLGDVTMYHSAILQPSHFKS